MEGRGVRCLGDPAVQSLLLTTGVRSRSPVFDKSSASRCFANPLTARVVVNRLWQFHFGAGIVSTPNDFGANGVPPSHPKLLDWLAGRLMSERWSLKSIHRLIMNSAVYQMSSRGDERALALDPTNNLFWRFEMRRLSAEEIRDSILWATGQLNTDKMYGPSIYTEIPDEVKAGQSRPGSGW